MRMKILSIITTAALVALTACSFAQSNHAVNHSSQLKAVDEYTLAGAKNLLTDYAPLHEDGAINVVVEIPAGATDKWEVSKPEGALKWEIKNGKPRVVQYLGYPGNYGMVPRTLLPKELGGDGDPLDVIVLGPAVPRGAIVKAKLVGVLKLLDRGEQDDKLLAVMADTPLFAVNDLNELNEKFPGVTTIVETWFENYKGRGLLESKGFGDVEEAQMILTAAIKAFQKAKKN